METMTKHEVKEITWAEKTFMTKRATLGMDKLSSFFTEAYDTIFKALKMAGIESTEPPCAIYYSVDPAKKETDVAAAVPVKEIKIDLAGLQKVTIPKSKALLITFYGSYENMAPAYDMLEKYAASHNLKKEWMIEEYFSDPVVEKDPSKWKTNIYFILK